MKRLLFLDFDGVLHPVGTPPGQTLPFEWLPQLATLLAPTADVAIAVHSSWAQRYSLDDLMEFLGPLGARLIGAVGPGPKAQAIQDFLRQRQDVNDWIVLDDDDAEFPGDFAASVILCDRTQGISDPAVQDRIRRWLSARGRELGV